MQTNSATLKVGDDSSETEISRKTQANSKLCKGYDQNTDNGRSFSYCSERDCNLSERERYNNGINTKEYQDTISIRDRNKNLIVKHPTVNCRNILLNNNVIRSSQCQCEVLGSRQQREVLNSY